MTVRRIVPVFAAETLDLARSFYGNVLGMAVAMDLGWIVTFTSGEAAPAQLSIALEGGGGAPVPDVSVEVTDLDDVYGRAVAGGFAVEYGPVTEPWGVRRFFVRDPLARLVNILEHA